MSESVWRLSHRFASAALPLANRHYNRQSPESPQFVPPGRCIVLMAEGDRALWVSSWPEFARHAWEGAWMNTLFRNEGAGLSSLLITAAVVCTRSAWGDPPPLGFVTFIDAAKTRRKRDPGRCYRRAGWKHVGFTQSGLWAFQLAQADFPAAVEPVGFQRLLGFSLLSPAAHATLSPAIMPGVDPL